MDPQAIAKTIEDLKSASRQAEKRGELLRAEELRAAADRVHDEYVREILKS